MGRKKELYIIITFLISLSLVFGSVQYNFSAASDELSPAAWNNSYNNSTGHGNFTLQLNNSTNQTIVTPINQTIINNTTANNQIIPDIIFDDMNISLNLFTAGIAPPDIINTPELKAAAGDPTNTNETLNQTGELPPIKTHLSLTKCLKSTANAQSNDPVLKHWQKK